MKIEAVRQIAGPLSKDDYALDGALARQAQELGMHGAQWYQSPVPRAEMKRLMKRSDGPALRDTAVWLGLLFATGALAYAFRETLWLSALFFAIYGVLYASAGEARWHECSHGTPFKTRWMNEAVFQIASFLAMRNPVVSRWSHARHHTDTYIIGLDPEITSFRPPDILRQIAAFFGLQEFPLALRTMVRQALGRLDEAERVYVPESEQPKVQLVAIIWCAVYAGVIGLCIYSQSILPALFVGLPRIYGVWFIQLVALPQHAGLLDDVFDHRLDSRTFYLNPVGRFIYWNMNYHVEHHMFPMVPYYNLPALHELIKADCPPAYPSLWATYREIVPTLARQLRDPDYRVVRPLPEAAGRA
jgi:fatty acid desaturase